MYTAVIVTSSCYNEAVICTCTKCRDEPRPKAVSLLAGAAPTEAVDLTGLRNASIATTTRYGTTPAPRKRLCYAAAQP